MTGYEIRADLWRHDGDSPWHFVTLPAEIGDEIRARYAGGHRPFGSLPVRATIGTTSWETSLFADTKSGSYLLPVKADVRSREGIGAGDAATLRIDVVA